MKTLYMVRHAKSSWDDPRQDDFDRPLNERGVKDAPRMGKRLKEREITPDVVISSPAVRALSTAKLIVGVLHCPESLIHEDRSIYHAGSDSLLKAIREIDDQNEVAMIVGHNPGLTEFAKDLLGQDIDNIPTAGVVAGKLKIDSWKDAAMGCGKLLFFDFPRKK